MLKLTEIAHQVLEQKIEEKGLNREKNINNWINNRVLYMAGKFDELSDSKIQGTLNRNFSNEELKAYSSQYLKKDMEDGFGREHVRRLSQRLGINNYERKAEYKRRVNELTEIFVNLIDGDKQSYHTFLEKYGVYAFNEEDTENVAMQKFIPLGVMIALVGHEKNPLNVGHKEKNCMKNMDFKIAKFMISDIQYEIGCLLELRKRRKDTNELINSFKTIVEDTAEEREEGVVETLESVKLERDQYKTSLKLIQNSLEELSENVKEETEVMTSERIKDFFITLNSARYGNFLDKIPLIEKLLSDIRDDESYSELSQDVKKVFIFIKVVIKFIKDQDIEPIEQMDRVFKANADDIAKMDYSGDEFIGDEIKTVRVVAPGYKYKDLTISIPKVEEVKE